MRGNSEYIGLVLFACGVIGLGASWLAGGIVAAVVGVGTVLLLSVGTVLIGTKPRPENTVSGRKS